MSRSFKKVPNWNDGPPHNFYKRYSNKKIRQRQREMLDDYEKGDVVKAESLELDDGKDFRKIEETWNIRDYSFCFFNGYDDSWSSILRWDPQYIVKAMRK